MKVSPNGHRILSMRGDTSLKTRYTTRKEPAADSGLHLPQISGNRYQYEDSRSKMISLTEYFNEKRRAKIVERDR